MLEIVISVSLFAAIVVSLEESKNYFEDASTSIKEALSL